MVTLKKYHRTHVTTNSVGLLLQYCLDPPPHGLGLRRVQWQANALASDNSHLNFIAGDTDTNGLIYNLYADQLLQLDLVPDSLYEVATVFYNNIASE